VPEFMPYFTSVEPIVRRVEAYLQDRTLLAKTSNELIDVVEPLTLKKASEETARIVAEMLR